MLIKNTRHKIINFLKRFEDSAAVTAIFFIVYYLLTLVFTALPFKAGLMFKLWMFVSMVGAFLSYLPIFSECTTQDDEKNKD